MNDLISRTQLMPKRWHSVSIWGSLIAITLSLIPVGVWANNQQSAQQILENAQAAQGVIAQQMDQLWTDVLNSSLYEAMATVGVLFASFLVVLFVVRWLREALDNELNPTLFNELIWLFLVILLLANNGFLLKQSTLGLRAVITITNQQVLAVQIGGMSLQSSYQQVIGQNSIQTWLQQQTAQCNTLPDSNTRQTCLDQVYAQGQQAAGQLPQQPNSNWWNGVTGAIGTVLEKAVEGWLIAFGIAFQWLVEVILLLTGLLGPLAVGGTLLPVGQRSLFAWMIAFYSVGLCKLCFNVLVGLVAILVNRAPTGSTMIFAFAVGLLSPILAVCLAAGGGMTVFMSLGSLGGMVTAKMAGFAYTPIGAGVRMGMQRVIPRRVRRYFSNR